MTEKIKTRRRRFKTKMIRVIIESPFAGDINKNIKYLQLAMRDCLLRGESPFASHGLYTQPNVLNDSKPAERKIGIDAGFEWGKVAEKIVVYEDLGISNGMQLGIDNAEKNEVPVEYRKLSHIPQINKWLNSKI